MTATAIHASSEVLAFLHAVLCDGRHVDDFHVDPEAAAHDLGLALSERAIAEIESTDRDDLLRDLYEHQFAPTVERPHEYIVQNVPNADLGLTVLIGIVAGTLVTAFAAKVILKDDKQTPKPMKGGPVDTSKGKDEKP